MAVIWPVAYLDAETLCSNSGWKKDARPNNGDE